jgi:hypothetical protein
METLRSCPAGTLSDGLDPTPLVTPFISPITSATAMALRRPLPCGRGSSGNLGRRGFSRRRLPSGTFSRGCPRGSAESPLSHRARMALALQP